MKNNIKHLRQNTQLQRYYKHLNKIRYKKSSEQELDVVDDFAVSAPTPENIKNQPCVLKNADGKVVGQSMYKRLKRCHTGWTSRTVSDAKSQVGGTMCVPAKNPQVPTTYPVCPAKGSEPTEEDAPSIPYDTFIKALDELDSTDVDRDALIFIYKVRREFHKALSDALDAETRDETKIDNIEDHLDKLNEIIDRFVAKVDPEAQLSKPITYFPLDKDEFTYLMEDRLSLMSKPGAVWFEIEGDTRDRTAEIIHRIMSVDFITSPYFNYSAKTQAVSDRITDKSKKGLTAILNSVDAGIDSDVPEMGWVGRAKYMTGLNNFSSTTPFLDEIKAFEVYVSGSNPFLNNFYGNNPELLKSHVANLHARVLNYLNDTSAEYFKLGKTGTRNDLKKYYEAQNIPDILSKLGINITPYTDKGIGSHNYFSLAPGGLLATLSKEAFSDTMPPGRYNSLGFIPPNHVLGDTFQRPHLMVRIQSTKRFDGSKPMHFPKQAIWDLLHSGRRGLGGNAYRDMGYGLNRLKNKYGQRSDVYLSSEDGLKKLNKKSAPYKLFNEKYLMSTNPVELTQDCEDDLVTPSQRRSFAESKASKQNRVYRKYKDMLENTPNGDLLYELVEYRNNKENAKAESIPDGGFYTRKGFAVDDNNELIDTPDANYPHKILRLLRQSQNEICTNFIKRLRFLTQNERELAPDQYDEAHRAIDKLEQFFYNMRPLIKNGDINSVPSDVRSELQAEFQKTAVNVYNALYKFEEAGWGPEGKDNSLIRGYLPYLTEFHAMMYDLLDPNTVGIMMPKSGDYPLADVHRIKKDADSSGEVVRLILINNSAKKGFNPNNASTKSMLAVKDIGKNAYYKQYRLMASRVQSSGAFSLHNSIVRRYSKALGAIEKDKSFETFIRKYKNDCLFLPPGTNFSVEEFLEDSINLDPKKIMGANFSKHMYFLNKPIPEYKTDTGEPTTYRSVLRGYLGGLLYGPDHKLDNSVGVKDLVNSIRSTLAAGGSNVNEAYLQVSDNLASQASSVKSLYDPKLVINAVTYDSSIPGESNINVKLFNALFHDSESYIKEKFGKPDEPFNIVISKKLNRTPIPTSALAKLTGENPYKADTITWGQLFYKPNNLNKSKDLVPKGRSLTFTKAAAAEFLNNFPDDIKKAVTEKLANNDAPSDKKLPLGVLKSMIDDAYLNNMTFDKETFSKKAKFTTLFPNITNAQKNKLIKYLYTAPPTADVTNETTQSANPNLNTLVTRLTEYTRKKLIPAKAIEVANALALVYHSSRFIDTHAAFNNEKIPMDKPIGTLLQEIKNEESLAIVQKTVKDLTASLNLHTAGSGIDGETIKPQALKAFRKYLSSLSLQDIKAFSLVHRTATTGYYSDLTMAAVGSQLLMNTLMHSQLFDHDVQTTLMAPKPDESGKYINIALNKSMQDGLLKTLSKNPNSAISEADVTREFPFLNADDIKEFVTTRGKDVQSILEKYSNSTIVSQSPIDKSNVVYAYIPKRMMSASENGIGMRGAPKGVAAEVGYGSTKMGDTIKFENDYRRDLGEDLPNKVPDEERAEWRYNYTKATLDRHNTLLKQAWENMDTNDNFSEKLQSPLINFYKAILNKKRQNMSFADEAFVDKVIQPCVTRLGKQKEKAVVSSYERARACYQGWTSVTSYDRDLDVCVPNVRSSAPPVYPNCPKNGENLDDLEGSKDNLLSTISGVIKNTPNFSVGLMLNDLLKGVDATLQQRAKAAKTPEEKDKVNELLESLQALRDTHDAKLSPHDAAPTKKSKLAGLYKERRMEESISVSNKNKTVTYEYATGQGNTMRYEVVQLQRPKMTDEEIYHYHYIVGIKDFNNVYEMDFTINDEYEMQNHLPRLERAELGIAAQEAFKKTFNNAPDGTIFINEPYDDNDDDLQKRIKNYEKAGFEAVPRNSMGYRGMAAYKKNGKLYNITDSKANNFSEGGEEVSAANFAERFVNYKFAEGRQVTQPCVRKTPDGTIKGIEHYSRSRACHRGWTSVTAQGLSQGTCIPDPNYSGTLTYPTCPRADGVESPDAPTGFDVVKKAIVGANGHKETQDLLDSTDKILRQYLDTTKDPEKLKKIKGYLDKLQEMREVMPKKSKKKLDNLYDDSKMEESVESWEEDSDDGYLVTYIYTTDGGNQLEYGIDIMTQESSDVIIDGYASRNSIKDIQQIYDMNFKINGSFAMQNLPRMEKVELGQAGQAAFERAFKRAPDKTLFINEPSYGNAVDHAKRVKNYEKAGFEVISRKSDGSVKEMAAYKRNGKLYTMTEAKANNFSELGHLQEVNVADFAEQLMTNYFAEGKQVSQPCVRKTPDGTIKGIEHYSRSRACHKGWTSVTAQGLSQGTCIPDPDYPGTPTYPTCPRADGAEGPDESTGFDVIKKALVGAGKPTQDLLDSTDKILRRYLDTTKDPEKLKKIKGYLGKLQELRDVSPKPSKKTKLEDRFDPDRIQSQVLPGKFIAYSYSTERGNNFFYKALIENKKSAPRFVKMYHDLTSIKDIQQVYEIDFKINDLVEMQNLPRMEKVELGQAGKEAFKRTFEQAPDGTLFVNKPAHDNAQDHAKRVKNYEKAGFEGISKRKDGAISEMAAYKKNGKLYNITNAVANNFSELDYLQETAVADFAEQLMTNYFAEGKQVSQPCVRKTPDGTIKGIEHYSRSRACHKGWTSVTAQGLSQGTCIPDPNYPGTPTYPTCPRADGAESPDESTGFDVVKKAIVGANGHKETQDLLDSTDKILRQYLDTTKDPEKLKKIKGYLDKLQEMREVVPKKSKKKLDNLYDDSKMKESILWGEDYDMDDDRLVYEYTTDAGNILDYTNVLTDARNNPTKTKNYQHTTKINKIDHIIEMGFKINNTYEMTSLPRDEKAELGLAGRNAFAKTFNKAPDGTLFVNFPYYGNYEDHMKRVKNYEKAGFETIETRRMRGDLLQRGAGKKKPNTYRPDFDEVMEMAAYKMNGKLYTISEAKANNFSELGHLQEVAVADYAEQLMTKYFAEGRQVSQPCVRKTPDGTIKGIEHYSRLRACYKGWTSTVSSLAQETCVPDPQSAVPTTFPSCPGSDGVESTDAPTGFDVIKNALANTDSHKETLRLLNTTQQVLRFRLRSANSDETETIKSYLAKLQEIKDLIPSKKPVEPPPVAQPPKTQPENVRKKTVDRKLFDPERLQDRSLPGETVDYYYTTKKGNSLRFMAGIFEGDSAARSFHRKIDPNKIDYTYGIHFKINNSYSMQDLPRTEKVELGIAAQEAFKRMFESAPNRTLFINSPVYDNEKDFTKRVKNYEKAGFEPLNYKKIGGFVENLGLYKDKDKAVSLSDVKTGNYSEIENARSIEDFAEQLMTKYFAEGKQVSQPCVRKAPDGSIKGVEHYNRSRACHKGWTSVTAQGLSQGTCIPDPDYPGTPTYPTCPNPNGAGSGENSSESTGFDVIKKALVGANGHKETQDLLDSTDKILRQYLDSTKDPEKLKKIKGYLDKLQEMREVMPKKSKKKLNNLYDDSRMEKSMPPWIQDGSIMNYKYTTDSGNTMLFSSMTSVGGSKMEGYKRNSGIKGITQVTETVFTINGDFVMLSLPRTEKVELGQAGQAAFEKVFNSAPDGTLFINSPIFGNKADHMKRVKNYEKSGFETISKRRDGSVEEMAAYKKNGKLYTVSEAKANNFSELGHLQEVAVADYAEQLMTKYFAEGKQVSQPCVRKAPDGSIKGVEHYSRLRACHKGWTSVTTDGVSQGACIPDPNYTGTTTFPTCPNNDGTKTSRKSTGMDVIKNALRSSTKQDTLDLLESIDKELKRRMSNARTAEELNKAKSYYKQVQRLRDAIPKSAKMSLNMMFNPDNLEDVTSKRLGISYRYITDAGNRLDFFASVTDKNDIPDDIQAVGLNQIDRVYNIDFAINGAYNMEDLPRAEKIELSQAAQEAFKKTVDRAVNNSLLLNSPLADTPEDHAKRVKNYEKAGFEVITRTPEGVVETMGVYKKNDKLYNISEARANNFSEGGINITRFSEQFMTEYFAEGKQVSQPCVRKTPDGTIKGIEHYSRSRACHKGWTSVTAQGLSQGTCIPDPNYPGTPTYPACPNGAENSSESTGFDVIKKALVGADKPTQDLLDSTDKVLRQYLDTTKDPEKLKKIKGYLDKLQEMRGEVPKKAKKKLENRFDPDNLEDWSLEGEEIVYDYNTEEGNNMLYNVFITDKDGSPEFVQRYEALTSIKDVQTIYEIDFKINGTFEMQDLPRMEKVELGQAGKEAFKRTFEQAPDGTLFVNAPSYDNPNDHAKRVKNYEKAGFEAISKRKDNSIEEMAAYKKNGKLYNITNAVANNFSEYGHLQEINVADYAEQLMTRYFAEGKQVSQPCVRKASDGSIKGVEHYSRLRSCHKGWTSVTAQGLSQGTCIPDPNYPGTPTYPTCPRADGEESSDESTGFDVIKKALVGANDHKETQDLLDSTDKVLRQYLDKTKDPERLKKIKGYLDKLQEMKDLLPQQKQKKAGRSKVYNPEKLKREDDGPDYTTFTYAVGDDTLEYQVSRTTQKGSLKRYSNKTKIKGVSAIWEASFTINDEYEMAKGLSKMTKIELGQAGQAAFEKTFDEAPDGTLFVNTPYYDNMTDHLKRVKNYEKAGFEAIGELVRGKTSEMGAYKKNGRLYSLSEAQANNYSDSSVSLDLSDFAEALMFANSVGTKKAPAMQGALVSYYKVLLKKMKGNQSR